VVKSAASFEHINIHPDVWTRVRPRSSAQAHLVLKGAQLTGDVSRVETLALRIRSAFFAEAQDIGQLDVLLALAAEAGLDKSALQNTLDDGSAIAALSSDLRAAADKGVKGSPTWVLNEGRQLLYGNVGYRILSANIEELLRNPSDEASWC
jgi:predicted DsbA family dithiol-disulfide isomerase